MKKRLKIILALTILLVTSSSCVTQKPKETIIKLRDVNKKNWIMVTKNNFGLEIEVPKGYELKKVESPNKLTNLSIYLDRNSGISEYKFGTKIFDKTAKITKGDYAGNMDYQRKVFKSYQDAKLTDKELIVATWYYYFYDTKNERYAIKQITYSVINDVVQISLLAL